MREINLENIVDFIRLLRYSGFRVGLSEDIDVGRAIIGIYRFSSSIKAINDLREVLRIILVKNPDQYEVFDKLFDRFWLYGDPLEERAERRVEVRIIREEGSLDPVSRFLSIYSPLEVRGRTPREISIDGRARHTIRRAIRMLRRRLSTEPGVRMRISSRGRLDFPLSYREALSTFGEVIRLRRSRRKISRSHFVFLIDVSGSMEDSWESIARLLKSIRGFPIGSYEVFLFSTGIIRATENIVEGEVAIKRILAESGVWGSGTRIGEALDRLIKEYRKFIGRTSVVIIVSDGWDLGDLDLLDRSLSALRGSVRRILWLSPYAGKKGFAPETACLRIAIKHVDSILPADILHNISILRRYLRSIR